MEAVPRMPMLAFELKTSSEPVEFTPVLKYYISEIYHEDPEAYTKECHEFDQLRQAAVQVSKDFVGCSVLKKYYCQLHFLHSRFPLLAQRPDDGSSDLIFTWDDVYMGRPISHSQTTYEQACILYNIGALHSILGALDNRQTPEGMKVSCTHFQCATWAFEHLRDHFGSVLSPDMSRDMLTFQAQLMLAQAQECILEKSMADNRKSTITAKVAEQIVEYYQMALKALDTANASNILGSRQLKEWKRRLEMMSNYHRSVKFLYLSNQSEEQQKWGERLTYLQEAHTRLTECIKMAKNDDDEIQEALRFTMDVVGGKYNSAKKDNDFIYHEKVPELASLPDVKGASLVKGIPFNTDDPEVSGPDIFRKLVPIEAHEASSLYSEEKAKLLRRIGAAIDEKDAELDHFLSSLQVDVAHLRPDAGVDILPNALMTKCAALSVRPDVVADLVKCMRSLANVVTDAEGGIQEIKDRLAEEQKEETEFQAVFGKRAFNVTLAEIKKECDKYEEATKKGTESNAELRRAMDTHITNLKMLALPPEELAKALPSVSPAGSAEDDLTVKEMERLFMKVDEMKMQRQRFGEQFREQVHTDDITNVLVTRDEVNQEEFFREQLKKHDKLVGLIEQNLAAQKNILQTLTETNAKYAPVKKQLADAVHRRDKVIQGLMLSYDVYDDLLAKCHKGVEFYERIQANVATLLERTERVCHMQHEERQQIHARHRPKAAAPARPGASKPGMVPSGAPVGQPDTQPKLKDYLPFMKPATFGQGSAAALAGQTNPYSGVSPTLSNIPQLPSHIGSASAPSSQSASPMHMPQMAASQPASPAHATVPGKPLPTQGYSPSGGIAGRTGVPRTMPVTTGVSSQPPGSVAGVNYSGATTQMYYSAASRNQGQLPPGEKSTNVPVTSMQQYQMPGHGSVQAPPGGAGSPQPSSQSNVYAMTHQPYPGIGQPSGQSQMTPVTTVPQRQPQGQGSAYYTAGNVPHQLASQPPGGAQYTPSGHSVQAAGGYPGQPQAYLPSGAGQRGAGQQQQQPGTLPPQVPYPQQTTHPVPGQQVGYRPPSQATPGAYATQAGQQPYLPQGVTPQSQPGQQTIYQGTPHTLAGAHTGYQPHPQGAGMQAAYQPHMPTGSSNMPTSHHPQMPGSNTNTQTGYQQQLPSNNTNMSSNIANMQAAYRPQIPCSNTGMPTACQQQPPSSSANIHAAYQSQLPSSNTGMSTTHRQQPPSSNTNMYAAYQPQISSCNTNMSTAYQPQASNANLQTTYQPQPLTSSPNMLATGQPLAQGNTTNLPATFQPQSQVGTSSNANMQAAYQPQLQSNNINMQTAYRPPSQANNVNMQAAYQPQSQANNMQTVYRPQAQANNINMQTTHQSQSLAYNVSGNTNMPAAYQSQPNSANMQASYQPQSQASGANIQAAYQPQSQASSANIQAAYQPQSQATNANIQAAYQPQSQASNANTQAAYQPQPQATNANTQAAYQPQPQATNANTQAAYQPQLQSTAATPQAVYQTPASATYQSQLQQQQWQQPQNQQQPQQLPPPSPQQQQQPLQPSVQQPHPLPAPLKPTPAKPTTLTASKPPERASSLPPDPKHPSAHHSRQNSNASNCSSLDDIFSTSPESSTCSDGVLRPRVVTAEEVRRLKEEEEKNQLKLDAQKDPYMDPAVLDRFVAQVSKFEKLVDGLTKHTLNGPTPLDKEWKELNDEQDQFSRKCSMAIARCYPLKNHYPHIMPYDASRVLLTGGKDDYINASHIGDLVASCPKVIATQHPLPATVADFWQMVYEQGTEVIVMLCHTNELNKRLHPYWPEVKGQAVTFGPFSISLQSVQTKQAWTERILSFTNNKTHQTRPVVHLQFTHWPPSGEPESPSLLLQFISQVHSFYIQQRNLMKPLVVHCSNGVGRTGTFCVIYTGVQEVNRGHGIVDIVELVQRLRQRRKYMVEEQSQLAFSYRAILYFAQDLLMKRGILTSRASFGDKLPARGERVHQRTPSEDFIMGTGSSLGVIQSNIAKMSFKTTTTPNTATTANNHTSGPPPPESSASNSDNTTPGDAGVTSAVNSQVSGQGETETGDSLPEPTGLSCDDAVASTIPESLAKLQDPHTFQLGTSTPPSETRITKASFTNKTTNLADNLNKMDDPLSSLDPLWTMKGQSQSS